MRVLLSLGNRSRDSSNNSETNDDYSGGIVETSTHLDSPIARPQNYDPLRRVDTPEVLQSEGILVNKNQDTARKLNYSDSTDYSSTERNCVDSSGEQAPLGPSILLDEADQPIPNEESLRVSSAQVPHIKSKRLRSDSISESKYPTVPVRRKMAVGGRFKSDSDDDESSFAVEVVVQHPNPPRRFWVEPAENEAPFVIHSSSHPANVASPVNPDDDDDDDDREMPRSSNHGNDLVAVAAISSDETLEDVGLMQFIAALKKCGFEMIEQEGDGNCLFRAVSLQVYGSADNHSEVRERCMDYMAQNEEHFSDFIAVSSDDEVIIPQDKKSMTAFQVYIARKRVSGVHGNHTEIQALSELFNRPVEVYTPESLCADSKTLQPMNIFHEEYKTSDPPIRLSYHDGNHYNAIIDPLVPTAGLGLGLPGLKVGLADKMQITKAITESDQLADQLELERVLKESKEEVLHQTDDELQKVLSESTRDYMYEQKMMALSDFDETNFALEQKALASSMETYFRQEHGRKQRATVTSVGSASRRRRCSPVPHDVDNTTQSNPTVAPPVVAVPAAAHSPAMASLSSHETARDRIYSSPVTEHAVLDEEYPQVVQELVMNGFELQDVIRAYEFVGDRFDDLLSLLLSSSKRS